TWNVDTKTMRMLLEAGADPNIGDNRGNTAMSIAAGFRNPNYSRKTIPLLQKYGAASQAAPSKS
nr:hypothetical protein [Schwartzia sp. (in: firmicutes)]